MASGLFLLLDDVAMLADDMAMLSKIAVKKTASILGDDLAVNAEKAQGFSASRELPMIWEITKGSFKNKLIILPIILGLGLWFPYLVQPILFFGGIFLAYEGTEKVLEYVLGVDNEKRDIVISEKQKIRSAILTDFVLSIEIIVIALSSVEQASMMMKILVVSFTAFIATVGVYGIVAIIVRLDDNGLKLIKLGSDLKESGSKFYKPITSLGFFLVKMMPIVIKLLTIVGTVAMLLVAGGIFLHQIHIDLPIHELLLELLVAFNLGFIVLLGKKFVKEIRSLF